MPGGAALLRIYPSPLTSAQDARPRGGMSCCLPQRFQTVGLRPLLFTPGDGIKTKGESYEVNSRGVEIFSKSWFREASRPRALGLQGDWHCLDMEFSLWTVLDLAYQKGLHGYIPSFDLLVEDVIEHYSNIKVNRWSRLAQNTFQITKCLDRRSLGSTHVQNDMVPPPVLKQILIGLASVVLPKHKLVPQKDLAEAKVLEMSGREKCGKPTAVDMLRTTQEIEQQLHKVCLPILILHGEADRVTDLICEDVLRSEQDQERQECAATTERDELVAQALFDLENTNQELKSELKDLYINQAVYAPKFLFLPLWHSRLRKAFRKIHPRLVRELEKKFSGKDVIFLLPQEGSCVLPRRVLLFRGHATELLPLFIKLCSRMLLAYPAEIVGKRTRYRLDGSKIMKVYLDTNERNNTEYKLETMIGVYVRMKETLF
ncbi:hypothetical protein Bca4012_011710 [Brassica carinata]